MRGAMICDDRVPFKGRHVRDDIDVSDGQATARIMYIQTHSRKATQVTVHGDCSCVQPHPTNFL